MELHILDTSNYIYAGTFSGFTIQRGVRESDGEYGPNEAPIGGVRFLLHQIGIIMRNPNAVIMPVFDRPPVIKRQMYYDTFGLEYGYKAGRKSKDNSIGIQRNYAEEILRDMGFVVQCAEEYEADDIIHSLVQYYKNDYDHIYIHTKDSDLHYLVGPNVSIEPVGDKGKHIDFYNYTTACKKDEFMPYNTVHLRKLISGDTSDNIPGIGKEWAPLIDKVMKPDEYQKLGDLDFARKILRETVAANPSQPGGHNVLRTFNILCPLLVPYDLINDDEPMVNEDKLNYYLHNWNVKEDIWGLEDMLAEYIDSYYR